VGSAGAIARRYRAASGIAVPGALEVLTAAAAGDADAVRIWDDALRALAEQLARLAAVLAPEAIVLGGGLAQAGPDLFEPLAERLDGLLSFHRRPALLRARLGDDAGLLGTALAARDLASTLADRTVP
jgi:glucokinase